MRNAMVLAFAALLGCAADPVQAPPAECACPPVGMVMVPTEIAAKFLVDINEMDESLDACKKESARWQARRDCS